MKKRKLSSIELKKVLELRQLGANWAEIQRETKVERRAAKRAYEEWERDKKGEEQEAVRFRAVAEAFHEHQNDLIRLAGALVANLSLPPSLTDMEKNTKQFYSWFLDQDLLQRGLYISSDTKEPYKQTQHYVYTMGDTQPFRMGGLQLYRREKELLLESLKVHTREDIQWEDILDNRWNKARDNCAKIVPKLRKETSDMVNSFLKQERETNFLQRIKEEEQTQHDPIEEMAKAVLAATWQGIVEDKLGQDLVRMVSPGSGGQGLVKVKDETFLIYNDTSLAEKVIHMCNLVANNLSKGDIKQLQQGVRIMEKAAEELAEMLNPVKLTLLILRTRCDLCPAWRIG